MSVLVVGAAGFVGRSVVAALLDSATPVRALHRTPAPAAPDPLLVPVVGDLTDPATLVGAFEGVDAVVHAASYVGRDPRECERVNDQGTLHLVDAARAAGAARIVYVSTTSVYGTGPHRSSTVGSLAIHPESPASASRARAEEHVLAAGGTVVRANLVHGAGDRWFLPALLTMTGALSAWVEEGSARVSTVHVRELGRAVAALAARAVNPVKPVNPVPAVPAVNPVPVVELAGRVLHGVHPAPVQVRGLVTELAARLGRGVPERSVSLAEAERLLAPAGVSAHQVALVSLDHSYDAGDFWELAGVDPGAPGALDDADVAWYAAALRAAR